MPSYQNDPQNALDMNQGSGKRPSQKKRQARMHRKQPSLPNGGTTSLQQQQQLKQQLLQKVLMKQNLKQHSLTSSDENLNDDFESRKKRTTFYLILAYPFDRNFYPAKIFVKNQNIKLLDLLFVKFRRWSIILVLKNY